MNYEDCEHNRSTFAFRSAFEFFAVADKLDGIHLKTAILLDLVVHLC